MSALELLLVFIGGGIGSFCRYTVDGQLKRRTSLPLSTFTINITGAFLLGLIAALTRGTPLFYLLGTGFCGGFTTFSTAMVEIVKELRGRRPAWALILAGGQIILACCAAWVGMLIGNTL